MWLLIAEGGVALFLLVFIVWWTMFLPPKEIPGEDEDPGGDQDRGQP